MCFLIFLNWSTCTENQSSAQKRQVMICCVIICLDLESSWCRYSLSILLECYFYHGYACYIILSKWCKKKLVTVNPTNKKHLELTMKFWLYGCNQFSMLWHDLIQIILHAVMSEFNPTFYSIFHSQPSLELYFFRWEENFFKRFLRSVGRSDFSTSE